MATETLIWLIPLPPVIAFLLIIIFTNKDKALSHTIAVGAALLSWAGSMVVIWRAFQVGLHHLGEHPFGAESSINWIPTGATWLKIGVLVDPLSVAALFFVAWTVLMIFIYSVGYHNYGQPVGDHDRKGLPPHGATVEDEHGHKHKVLSIEPMYSRFFAFIGLFAFGMYTLVVSDNLLTLFVGWEIMGLCSYLLIGFWYGKPSARAAMIKAFITTRVGDVFMLLGIAYLYVQAGTLNFREIFFNEATLHKLATEPTGILGLSAAGLVGILLFIGAVGKSAQWPLHVWLPDAMEGPTPVSAMIHAATMVSAGVYMIIRMFPLLSAGLSHGQLTDPMSVMAFIGAFTALFSATIAVAQNDIKRVLAYSTISQLGFMVAALGIGAYVAAAFHLVTHAFFKALLFLGSGSVIHGMEHGIFHVDDHHTDPQDMFNMGGLREKMPITFWTFLVGGFALSGFPLITAGFWSKDEIFADAFAHEQWPVLVALALAAFLTAFYTMRQITLTFLGKPRTKAAENAHETPWTMTLPLVILAFFALAFGWLGIPKQFPVLGGLIPNLFHGVVYSLPEISMPVEINFSWIPLIISLFVALGGLGLGWLVYRNVSVGDEDPLRKPLGQVYKTLQNKYYFDEFYEAVFIKSAQWFSETFSYMWMDRKVIDGGLHIVARLSYSLGVIFRDFIDGHIINGFGDFIGESAKWVGDKIKVIQTGKIQQYMLIALLLMFTALFYIVFITLP
jgi:NADH-quinone oxidoreductase subunit L